MATLVPLTTDLYYGRKCKWVMDVMGRELIDLIGSWYTQGKTMDQIIGEISSAGFIYDPVEKRRIRRALARFLHRYYDPALVESFFVKDSGSYFEQAFAYYLNVAQDKALPRIIKDEMPIADLCVAIFGDNYAKPYSWIYSAIRNRYGREAVRKVCPNIRAGGRYRRASSAGYTFLDFPIPVNVSVKPTSFRDS